MIARGQIQQVDEIFALSQACGLHLRENGIDQWDENYPDRNRIQKDIESNQLFCHIDDENRINGIVVLNEEQDPEYAGIDWLTDDLSRSLVVHRLAVLPTFQGQGIATKLMDFAEEFGRENMYASIRLDTYSQNAHNQRFYEKRGYTNLGPVYLSYKKEHPYYCFELVL